MKAYIVSLGCPKNLTDSEVLMGNLVSQGYEITSDPSKSDLIIVNTCSFLQKSRDESFDVISEMAQWKKKGKCEKLYVAGCLPKYLKNQKISAKIQHVDDFIDSIKVYNCRFPRIKATNPWFAYVKISEGCNHYCSYCLIPSIRGKLRERKMEDILQEVKLLGDRGVKEIIYVAQDTTAYKKFSELLRRTAEIENIKWIRIMYAYPSHVSDELIDVIAKEDKIVKYLDMPIQHASDKILKLMKRNYDKKYLVNLISRLRSKIPNLALRTSIIVGFPGEDEKDFNELCESIKEIKFDKLGVFPYSREKGTFADKMSGQLDEKTKKQRNDKLMKIQAKISLQKNRALIGKTMPAIIEKKSAKNYIGRTSKDAPDIDGKVFIKSKRKLNLGDIVDIKITKAKRYDLEGKLQS